SSCLGCAEAFCAPRAPRTSPSYAAKAATSASRPVSTTWVSTSAASSARRSVARSRVSSASARCSRSSRSDRSRHGWSSRSRARRRARLPGSRNVIPLDQQRRPEESTVGEDQRTFLRGFGSETYGLGKFREQQRGLDRVRKAGTVTDDASVGHSGDSDEGKSRTWWMVGPGDESFLSQTLQVHFVELSPGGENHGHGHQNEAHFYILEGAGYEMHDGKRYQWKKDDLVIVHTDSKHKHHNLSATERALALVLKAKTTWMLLGMWQQGRSAPFKDEASYGPRLDWGKHLWTPGWEDQKKVITPADTKWESTRDGKVRVILSPGRTDARTHSLDLYEQDIPSG